MPQGQVQVSVEGWVLSIRKHIEDGDNGYYLAAVAMQREVDNGRSGREISRAVGCGHKRVQSLLHALGVHASQGIPFGEAYIRQNRKYGDGKEKSNPIDIYGSPSAFIVGLQQFGTACNHWLEKAPEWETTVDRAQVISHFETIKDNVTAILMKYSEEDGW